MHAEFAFLLDVSAGDDTGFDNSAGDYIIHDNYLADIVLYNPTGDDTVINNSADDTVLDDSAGYDSVLNNYAGEDTVDDKSNYAGNTVYWIRCFCLDPDSVFKFLWIRNLGTKVCRKYSKNYTLGKKIKIMTEDRQE